MAADFFMVTTRAGKKGTLEIYPKFIVKNRSKDLMIRGGDFYAIWLEEEGRWSLDEQDVIDLIDREMDLYFEQHKDRLQGAKVLHLWDAETGMIDTWHKFCQKQMRDSFHTLDEKIIFSNSEINKKDYASRRLSYPLQDGKCESYDKLMSVLYSPEERMKLEWAIGSIVCGDSKTIQKFLVLYGSAGTGKSTVLNIIQMLFDGYYSVFDAKVLGSTSNAFALEAFKDNPLVAIQHDGDLSRIEDNTRLNSLVSHEKMTVNNKFEKLYSQSFKAFLFMGTNKPVKITDAKSGILRRLIDVSPTGNKVPVREYNKLYSQIKFELGAIAWHCLKVYESNKGMYDDYIPYSMMSSTNDFYNFVEDAYLIFAEQDGVTLKQAWELYKTYCDEAKVWYPLQKMNFKSELKSYFKEFHDIYNLEDGSRCRNYYRGFRKDKFGFAEEKQEEPESPKTYILELKEQHSLLDDLLADYPAQYASDKETPKKKWDEITTKLKDLDTTKLHYILGLENHIVIDFDLTDENGEKSLERNIEEASKWPKTYAELSKSGKAVHLHYIYDGDVSKLSSVYDDHIEIKVYAGKSALRRKLTKCNDIPVAHISSGLPLRKEPKKMVNAESVKSEMGLRKLIVRNLNKEIHPSTKSSIDFIYKILDDAYSQGLHYDVSDMYQGVLEFGMGSTNNADYCIKLVNQMKFKSEEPSKEVTAVDDRLIFYDVEVFPNLFLVNWKFQGKSNVVRMINPKPHEIEELVKHRLVGFNCRRYDNHILYARMMGYSEIALYNLSQNIILNGKGFFSEAWNLSYTDVYDFCAKKQSLKKWEIELGIHHQELGLPWDKPVPEELWLKVAEYCDNDVIATEAVFDAKHADFVARQILADVAGMTVNDTTNSLTTRIIFGSNKKPQSQFNYRFMGDVSAIDEKKTKEIIQQYFGPDVTFIDDYTVFDKYGRPVFPGYLYGDVSIYRGEEVGEGGYVYAEPNIYTMVGLDDVESMHPSSVVAEQLFGEEYTQRFQEILQARIYIKHQEFDKAKKLLNGALAKYLDDENMAADLAQALKIAINSVYGLTAAKFENPFRDPRNVDNIVAKRGALFMVNLKHVVQERGYTVAHIKTDSIKIPDATNDILDFVSKYAKMYGYNFKHEATYEKMCLVNDAVYIASYLAPERCEQMYTYIPVDNQKHFKKHTHPWTATGTQFQVPYVFKKLFSHEDILFEDMCETKSVSKGDIYLDMNESMPDVSEYQKNLEKIVAAHKKGKSGMSDDSFKEYCFELENEIAAGHNYIFVGRVGSFTPIKPGCGGGVLVNNNGGKWSAVTGTKGYRWLEAEMVKELGKFDCIDESYYISLVDEAKDAIGLYGDFEWFVSDEPVAGPRDFSWLNVPAGIDDEVPFDEK